MSEERIKMQMGEITMCLPHDDDDDDDDEYGDDCKIKSGSQAVG